MGIGKQRNLNETAAIIEQSFRGLLETTRYRSITVKDVCEHAHVSRKTFYTYFDSKESIIEASFSRDVVDPVRSLCAMLSNDEVRGMGQAIHERIFAAVQEDGAYYRNLVVPMRGVDSTFASVATKALSSLYARTLERVGLSADTPEGSYIAYYFGSSLALMIERWICDGFALSQATMAKLYADMALPFWNILSER